MERAKRRNMERATKESEVEKEGIWREKVKWKRRNMKKVKEKRINMASEEEKNSGEKQKWKRRNMEWM